MWTLMKFPVRGKELLEEFDLPNLELSDVARLFPDKPIDEIGGLVHTIGEHQRRFIEARIGQKLDLGRYLYQLAEWRDA